MDYELHHVNLISDNYKEFVLDCYIEARIDLTYSIQTNLQHGLMIHIMFLL